MNFLALLKMSTVFNSLLDDAVSWAMSLTSSISLTNEALIAKLTCCGMSPVCLAILTALILAVTTPTTLPA